MGLSLGEKLFQYCVEQGASDIHLSAGLPPCFRIDGEIEKMPSVEPFPSHVIEGIINEYASPVEIQNIREKGGADFAIYVPSVQKRFRVNVFKQTRGMSAAFRVIPDKIPTLKDIGAPKVFEHFAHLHKGLVLVTGATGSGKSTTLAAIINHINHTQKKHILTLEDPVEFVHQPVNCVINQRNIGHDAPNFAEALKGALREDPDVILVGEMRDPETISLALTAAETGHLVFGTLHTNSAHKAVSRIVDSFSAGDKPFIQSMLSESLQAVVAQALLPKVGGGRVAAHEILIGTSAVKNLIREGKLAQIPSIMETGARYGMQTMIASVEQHYKEGTVSDKVRRLYAANISSESKAANDAA